MIHDEFMRTRDFLLGVASVAVGMVIGAGVHEVASELRIRGAWKAVSLAVDSFSQREADIAEAAASFEKVRDAICKDMFAGNGIREMQKAKIIEIQLC